MTRDWIGPALAALVAVAALSMAAATFDAARPNEGITLGGGEPNPVSGDVASGGAVDGGRSDASPILVPHVRFDLGGEGAASSDGGGSVPVVVAIAALGVLAVAAVVTYRLTSDDVRVDERPDDTRAQSTPPDAPWPVDPTLSNGVYRAWHDLARRTPVGDRRTATPGDVATAAVADGQPSDAVTQLTDEFCRVRYAEVAVTPDAEDRARRAVERLRPSRASEDRP